MVFLLGNCSFLTIHASLQERIENFTMKKTGALKKKNSLPQKTILIN